MPRRTFCQHPKRHTNSTEAPKIQRLVSRGLGEFIRARYDLEADDVTGLCAKCHAFESRQMEDDEDMEIDVRISSDDEMPNEAEHEEEDERNNDEEMDDQDGDGIEDSLLELTHQQQEAMETLSNVFRMLNMRTIHDQ
jgi:hypothetical protein